MKEYILNLLEEESNIVEELISIDNKIQNNDLTYSKLYKTIFDTNIKNNKINGKYIVITDGQLKTVLNIILNYTGNILCLNINHTSVAIYKWLVDRINKYSNDINIILDINNNYELYDKYDNFIITGLKEFVDGTSELYYDKNILKIVIEG